MHSTSRWIGVLNGDDFISRIYKSITVHNYRVPLTKQKFGNLTITDCVGISKRFGLSACCLLGRGVKGEQFIALLKVGRKNIENEIDRLVQNGEMKNHILLFSTRTGVEVLERQIFNTHTLVDDFGLSSLTNEEAAVLLAKRIKNI